MTCYRLDALGPDGHLQTRNRDVVTDTAGVAVAELSVVPRLFVARSLMAQRRIRPLPWPQRHAALTKAADVFRNSVVADLNFSDYVHLTARVSGLPVSVARSGACAVGHALETATDAVESARPVGAASDWRDTPAAGGAIWARRGEVLAVHAPGNAPGVHGLWSQALALGYRVAVRPSRREPFTAHRVVHALRQAGFRPADALYLPTDHANADSLVRDADLALVYGGRDVVDRYAGDSTVLTNGPGRTKMLITAEQDWREHLDVIVDSIAGLAGMACVNTTAVLYEGDAAGLAQAVAQRLSTIDDALLPTMTVDAARAMARGLARAATGTVPVLGADQVVAEIGDGRAVLRPAVHLLTRPDADTLNVELPFPCVWIASWSRADGLGPLRNSLVLNAITADSTLIDALLDEPTVTNVYSGRVPTHASAPHIPHDGFLADFLMRNKGFLRR